MKRITCIITAFLTFLFISINSLSVYALPSEIPLMNFYKMYVVEDFNNTAIFGHILCYRPSTNDYILYIITTPWNYRNEENIYLSTSDTGFYYLGSQDHLSSDTFFYFHNSDYENNESVFRFRGSQYATNSSINTDFDSLEHSLSINGLNGLLEVVASSVNLCIGDTVVFEGSESYLFSLVSPNTEYDLPHTSRDNYIEPVPPTTEAPTIGDTDYDKESVETSKSILENVKTIITNIANLPSNIANAIKNFFSDLLSGIITGLNNLKDGIIQGLKDLFIPSDNAFTDIQDIINEKFGFISQIKDMFSSIINATFTESGEAPEFNITIYGQELSIIDWSLYAPYRMIIHGIIIAVSYISFIMRLIKRIPKIIGGIS